jgi:glutamyl-tRNA synthetase
MSDVRTRFAPSPTGFIHVGGIRTALFAYLLAKQNDGKFILRLEDTDQKREIEGAKAHIIKSLRDLGLDYDEGPDKDGPYGPYVQSQRLASYKEWANKLVQSGRAYADPFAPEEVQAFREEAIKNKQPFLYRNHRPESPPTWDGTKPLRFKSEPTDYAWQDAVMGEMKSGPEVIDDFVLMKSDGYPTYNFAHIIDDFEMKISHVLRGQEFLSSIPNYLNLYEALGIDRPVLATLPHILAPSGQKKLSKRDGSKDVLDYIKEGYLAEALISFIATMGWNDGTEQEIYTRDELIQKFSLDRVQRSGARFDEARLNWINGNLIRQLPLDKLYEKVKDFWPEQASNYDNEYKMRVLSVVQERLKFFSELPELTLFFFTDLPINPESISNNKQLKKLLNPELIDLLTKARETLEQSNFEKADLDECLNKLLEQTGQKPAVLLSLIRIATTQAPASPGLSDSLAVLGKELSLKRINSQIESLQKQ